MLKITTEGGMAMVFSQCSTEHASREQEGPGCLRKDYKGVIRDTCYDKSGTLRRLG